MVLPEVGELLVREQRDVRIGKRFAQALQRGRGHHGVAQPVDAAHQNAAGWPGGGGWSARCESSSGAQASAAERRHRAGHGEFGPGGSAGAGFQRLCTQNQLAGSRRTAASKARLTSRMMAAVGARLAVLVGRDFRARFDAPAGQADAIADGGDAARSGSAARKRPARRWWSSRGPGRARAACRPDLVGQQAEHDARLVHEGLQARGVGAPLEKEAAGALAQGLQQAVERGLAQSRGRWWRTGRPGANWPNRA